MFQSPRQLAEERELGQARNLGARIFARDNNASVLIQVGNHQLAKSLPDDTELPVMMGEHLRRLTGLYTPQIDQTLFFAHPDPSMEEPGYAGPLKRFPSREPFVLRRADGSPLLLAMQGRIDMQVTFRAMPRPTGVPTGCAAISAAHPSRCPWNFCRNKGGA